MYGFQFGWLIGLFGSSNCCSATSALSLFYLFSVAENSHHCPLSLSLTSFLPVSLSTHFCNALLYHAYTPFLFDAADFLSMLAYEFAAVP